MCDRLGPDPAATLSRVVADLGPLARAGPPPTLQGLVTYQDLTIKDRGCLRAGRLAIVARPEVGQQQLLRSGSLSSFASIMRSGMHSLSLTSPRRVSALSSVAGLGDEQVGVVCEFCEPRVRSSVPGVGDGQSVTGEPDTSVGHEVRQRPRRSSNGPTS
jgi:hypothetical protein